jgi:type II secretory pathway pseudopilin PulG
MSVRRPVSRAERPRRPTPPLFRAPLAGRESERGFTLVEGLVTMTLAVLIGMGLYNLLDSSTRLAKQETQVSAAQQDSRTGMAELSRVVRQARAGQLFYGNSILPVANNSPGGAFVTDVAGGAHYIRKGTDVLGVRGVLFGDRYGLTGGDVTCGSILCTSDTPMTVTLRSTAANGVVNYRSGSTPGLASRTRPFHFAVLYGTLQTVTVANTEYLIPLYYVGRVDTTGNWYTQTADTFTFVMNPADSGARLWNAVTTVARELVQSPYSAGPVEEVLFFVDEGPADASTSSLDTHPTLAEAVFDPSTGRYDVQPLVDEVEDFQVAYGIDGADGSTHDRGVAPTRVDTSAANRDEWVGNVVTEVENGLTFSATEPHFISAFIDSSVSPGVPDLFSRAVPALRSVWLSLVVKSSDPEIRYGGPGARGIQILDSAAISFSSPAVSGRSYRRRATTLAVSLRNFQ